MRSGGNPGTCWSAFRSSASAPDGRHRLLCIECARSGLRDRTFVAMRGGRPRQMPRENRIASRPPLHPQFGLRSLFAAMTVCCLVLGTSHWLGPVAAIALAFVLLMVALHVAGNALGTRMRGGSPHRDGQSFAVGRPRGPTFAGSPVQAHPPHQPHHLAKGDRPSLHIFAFGVLGGIGGAAVGETNRSPRPPASRCRFSSSSSSPAWRGLLSRDPDCRADAATPLE